MTTKSAGLFTLASFALLAQAGCATPEQWKTWRSHDTHFASGQHLSFSLRNPGARAEQVKPTDPPKAQDESWWGRQLPMAPNQGGGS